MKLKIKITPNTTFPLNKILYKLVLLQNSRKKRYSEFCFAKLEYQIGINISFQKKKRFLKKTKFSLQILLTILSQFTFFLSHVSKKFHHISEDALRNATFQKARPSKLVSFRFDILDVCSQASPRSREKTPNHFTTPPKVTKFGGNFTIFFFRGSVWFNFCRLPILPKQRQLT